MLNSENKTKYIDDQIIDVSIDSQIKNLKQKIDKSKIFLILLFISIIVLLGSITFKYSLKNGFPQKISDAPLVIVDAMEDFIINFNAITFPEKLSEHENNHTNTFNWEYKDQEYSIQMVFFEEIYKYYKDNPAKRLTARISDQDYYERYIKKLEHEQDQTIDYIITELRKEANDLWTNDEFLEFTIAFVQSIPYDNKKNDTILSIHRQSSQEEIKKTWPRFPYETLYLNKGVCTDKSFLTIALLQRLDYGYALFNFNNEEHVAPAVQCPLQYSSYKSGYCHTEVTNIGFRIGEIPDMDPITKQATLKTSINLNTNISEENEAQPIKLLHSKNISKYAQTKGSVYERIIYSTAAFKKINELEDKLYQEKILVDKLKNKLSKSENIYNEHKQKSDDAYRQHQKTKDEDSYNDYKNLYNQYKEVYTEYQNILNQLNASISTYNLTAKQYNTLLQKYN